MRVAVVLKRVGLVHTFGRYVSFNCYIADHYVFAHVAVMLYSGLWLIAIYNLIPSLSCVCAAELI